MVGGGLSACGDLCGCGVEACTVFGRLQVEAAIERGVVQSIEEARFDVFSELFGGVGECVGCPQVVV